MSDLVGNPKDMFCHNAAHICNPGSTCNTTDDQSNAKQVVKQRHPGDEFPVTQRGSTKGKQSTSARI